MERVKTGLHLHSVLLLDDGREALCTGIGGDGDLVVSLYLMFADGSGLDDVPPERVTKVLSRLPSQNGAHPKPWPEPWQAASDRRQDQHRQNLYPEAPKLPPPSAETQATIMCRLEALAAQRRQREEVEAQAWRCEEDPEALLREALAGEEPHVVVFDEWVRLKASRPAGEITFYHCGQYAYTYHKDALRVSQLVEIPPTRARFLAKRGPAVLEFYEFDFYLERVALTLVAAGERVAFVEMRPSKKETVFASEEEVRAHVKAERESWRQTAVAAEVEKKGGAQLSLFEEEEPCLT